MLLCYFLNNANIFLKIHWNRILCLSVSFLFFLVPFFFLFLCLFSFLHCVRKENKTEKSQEKILAKVTNSSSSSSRAILKENEKSRTKKNEPSIKRKNNRKERKRERETNKCGKVPKHKTTTFSISPWELTMENRKWCACLKNQHVQLVKINVIDNSNSMYVCFVTWKYEIHGRMPNSRKSTYEQFES